MIWTLAALLSAAPMKGQTMADDVSTWAGGWKYAFSEEGRKAWKPEFTARYSSGFVTDGPAVTGGVRIDGKRTFGLMAGVGSTFINAAPGHVQTVSAGLYMRRYFHVGKKDIFAFYSDATVGAAYVYEVTGHTQIDDTGETVLLIDDRPGDILPYAAWHPGIRVRFWRNIHLFLGPAIATNTMGFHLGIGF